MTHPAGPTSWSITKRLQRHLLALLAALWIVAMIVATLLVTHETNEVYDDVLRGTAKMLGALAADAKASGQPIAKELEHLVLAGERADYISYQYRNADGSLRERSKTAPDTPFPAAMKQGFATHASIRYFTLSLKDGAGVVQVAETPDERNEAFYGLLAGFLLPLLALLIVGSALVWRAVGSVSEPLRAVAAEIRKRGGENLDALDAGDVPDELRPIVGDTNRLLSRLRRALDAERAFAANWAHELRNPIAAARAQSELIAGDLKGVADHERVDMLVNTLTNLSQRVERLLQKGRAESGATTGVQSSDLIAVVELVIDGYYYLPGERTLNFADGGFEAMPVAIDQDALAIVLQNLIDNAIGNSTAGSVVRIVLAAPQEIRVANDCAVVAPEELTKIRSRFQRGSSAARGGFGLGLAIVQQILGQSGGQLELKSPATGRSDGFEAIVRLKAG